MSWWATPACSISATYVAFYALGAYTCAALASPQFGRSTIQFGAIGVDKTIGGVHISIWLLLVVAGIFTALIGMLIGLPTLRLRGDYLAIVTLGFGEILPQIARNGDNFFNTGINVTNGPQGITPMRRDRLREHAQQGTRSPATTT